MPPTIGRDPERVAVEVLLDGDSARLAALVLEGEAGIGKTTVWGDAVHLARERQYLVLSSRPAQAETTLAFASLADLLEDPIDGWTIYPDPSGDTGSSVLPWVDIREVEFSRFKVIFDLVSNNPPLVDPIEQWIAYGVVVDDDRDGIPDRRFGIDNIPGTAPGSWEHRAWITDLHTGRTVAAVGAPYGWVGDTYFDTFFPAGQLSFGANVTGGGTIGGLPERFYAWASVIENGRVVATDYAPDVGWLDPSATNTP